MDRLSIVRQQITLQVSEGMLCVKNLSDVRQKFSVCEANVLQHAEIIPFYL